jgi:transposase-like protein
LLAKPQIREFAFQTQLFQNYQRSEKALLASICQMVTDGVSTNRVQKVVSRLSPDLIFSQSTVSRLLEESLESTLTYLSYPASHWRKIRTTNLIEGVLNKDLKQRSRVVSIFPNKASCLRYASLRLMEIDEKWQTGRRYMKIPEEDQKIDTSDTLLKEIKKIKEEVNAREELMVF